MEPHTPKADTGTVQKKTDILFTVTPLSKYLALTLFIILPFLGFWLGTLAVPGHYTTVEETVGLEQKITKPVTPNVHVASTTYQLEILGLEDTNASGLDIPQTEISLRTIAAAGTTKLSLGIFDGSCTVDSIINVYDNVSAYIKNPTQVIDQISCWFAGAGSETYLYKKTEGTTTDHEVITFETGACENLPLTECNPHGPVSVLKTGLIE